MSENGLKDDALSAGVDERTMANARVLVSARTLARLVQKLVKESSGSTSLMAAAQVSAELLQFLDDREEAFRFKW